MDHFRQGSPTRQGHKGIPEGCYEEEQGLKGFFGPVSHLIKRNPSTRWVSIDGPLRPHMFDLVKLMSTPGWRRLLYNAQVCVHIANYPSSAQPQAFRNADADTLYFCHQGEGVLLSEYGELPFKPGQYLVVPKCLTHAIVPKLNSVFFVVENLNSHFEQPERGIVGRHAIYDPNAIQQPNLDKMQSFLKQEALSFKSVKIKRLDQTTTFGYDECVFADVVGWKGDLYPFALHVDHMMPLMSHRAHLPPSAHTTFVARDFVVCTFLPRPLEEDADALKVPFYHQNIDYDEVLFYHAGDFFSRDNLHAGMMSFHPAGFPHGPHPKAVKSVGGKTHTSEIAVMVDTRWPLEIDPDAVKVELPNYWQSWKA